MDVDCVFVSVAVDCWGDVAQGSLMMNIVGGRVGRRRDVYIVRATAGLNWADVLGVIARFRLVEWSVLAFLCMDVRGIEAWIELSTTEITAEAWRVLVVVFTCFSRELCVTRCWGWSMVVVIHSENGDFLLEIHSRFFVKKLARCELPVESLCLIIDCFDLICLLSELCFESDAGFEQLCDLSGELLDGFLFGFDLVFRCFLKVCEVFLELKCLLSYWFSLVELLLKLVNV